MSGGSARLLRFQSASGMKKTAERRQQVKESKNRARKGLQDRGCQGDHLPRFFVLRSFTLFSHFSLISSKCTVGTEGLWDGDDLLWGRGIRLLNDHVKQSPPIPSRLPSPLAPCSTLPPSSSQLYPDMLTHHWPDMRAHTHAHTHTEIWIWSQGGITKHQRSTRHRFSAAAPNKRP